MPSEKVMKQMMAMEKEHFGKVTATAKEQIKRTLTVGELIERLRGCDPSSPVMIEIFEEVSSDGYLQSQESWVLETTERTQTSEDGTELESFILSASNEKAFEAFKAEFPNEE